MGGRLPAGGFATPARFAVSDIGAWRSTGPVRRSGHDTPAQRQGFHGCCVGKRDRDGRILPSLLVSIAAAPLPPFRRLANGGYMAQYDQRLSSRIGWWFRGLPRWKTRQPAGRGGARAYGNELLFNGLERI